MARLDDAHDQRRGERGHVAGDMIHASLWTLVSAVTSIPIAFGVSLVLARTLGPAGLGRLATYTALVGVATIVLNLGLTQATVQWIAEARAQDFMPQRMRLIRNSVGYHALLQGPAMAVVIFFMLREANPWVLIVAALAALATFALETSSVILSATARNATQAKILMIAGLAIQATTILVALVTRSAEITYAAQLAAGVLAPALGFLVIRSEERRAFFHPLVFRGLPPGFVRYGISACGAALVGTLVFGRSEIFVLEAHRLTVAAGIFALATGLAGQITIPMDSVMGPLLPAATRLLAEAPTRATETAARALRVTSILGSYTMATAIPAVEVAIPLLFGHRYEQAQSAFLLLGLVSCLQSVAVPLSMFVFATRNASSVLRINLICLAVDASLAIGLVPFFGLWGAVTANATAQLLSLALIAMVAVRRVGIDAGAIGQACRPLILGLTGAGLAVVLARESPLPTAAVLVLAPLAGLVVEVLGLRFLSAWRVSAAESALVEASLLVWLRPPYRWLARIFCLVAAPTNQATDE